MSESSSSSSSSNTTKSTGNFYLRYYSGHQGRYHHEFLEFEILPDGKLRYGNKSDYKKDGLIKKYCFIFHFYLNLT